MLLVRVAKFCINESLYLLKAKQRASPHAEQNARDKNVSVSGGPYALTALHSVHNHPLAGFGLSARRHSSSCACVLYGNPTITGTRAGPAHTCLLSASRQGHTSRHP